MVWSASRGEHDLADVRCFSNRLQAMDFLLGRILDPG